MPASVSWWERRDGVSFEKLGAAALAYCKASKAHPGVLRSRFYWVGADRIAVVTEADKSETLESSGRGKAMLELSELARNVGGERWQDPGFEQAQMARI